MNTLLALIALLSFAALGLWYFLTARPGSIVRAVRLVGPVILVGLGGLLILAGRGALGFPFIAMAIFLHKYLRRHAPPIQSQGQRSQVRTGMIDMELDHDTGEMNGVVLTGAFKGKALDDLSDAEIIEFARKASADQETALLLEAYLDRRMPGWRDGADFDAGAGQAGAGQSSAMTHEEAYEILGLEPGATGADIREAHRRLMQRVHPDVGGSAFLAARINAARDLLLRLHDS